MQSRTRMNVDVTNDHWLILSYLYHDSYTAVLKAEPGRPRESSDRRDKDQARSASRKRDRENERNGGRYAWVVIPTAVVTRLCAISRREGKAKRGNGGKETKRLRTCRIRSELIESDKSGRVVNADADERRERKWGPQLPAL